MFLKLYVYFIPLSMTSIELEVVLKCLFSCLSCALCAAYFAEL